jgi:hypothetical protein
LTSIARQDETVVPIVNQKIRIFQGNPCVTNKEAFER